MYSNFVGFEVFTELAMKNAVFWEKHTWRHIPEVGILRAPILIAICNDKDHDLYVKSHFNLNSILSASL
jgi:hypothetical protein